MAADNEINPTGDEFLIEETVKIMLKGVVIHSDRAEVAERARRALKDGKPLRFKLGLDPSAPDVHLGHAVPLRKLRQMQDLGHHAYIILGDFTGMIGDPSGRSKTRPPLTRDQVLENAKTYAEQIFAILDESKTIMAFNSKWLSALNFEDVLKLASKTTVARLLERDDFSNRFKSEQPISLHEFFYPLMQAYDSVAIRADVEIGGTDQTFNILMGRDIQRDYGQPPQITLMLPLLIGTDGVEKMSKSLGNYIGVREAPAAMYEKVMKIPDAQIINYYTLCTDAHPDDICAINASLESGENPRDVKMRLAREITALYHSADEASAAEAYFVDAYQRRQAPGDAPVLAYAAGGGDTPGYALAAALEKSGAVGSRSEARRLFRQGAVRINGERADDIERVAAIKSGDIVQIGKGKFYRIELVGK